MSDSFLFPWKLAVAFMCNVGSDLAHELCPSRSAVVPSRALVPLSALPGALIKLEMPPWGAFVFS